MAQGVTMQLAERLDYIEKGGPENGLVDLLHDLKNKKLTAEEVHAHYAAQYRPKVTGIMAAYQTGKLFEAQRQIFDDFMACKDLGRDIEEWLNAQSTFWMAGVKMDH